MHFAFFAHQVRHNDRFSGFRTAEPSAYILGPYTKLSVVSHPACLSQRKAEVSPLCRAGELLNLYLQVSLHSAVAVSQK